MPYIGYDIFTQRDTIPFWQNLPAPNDYKLGPGDEIIISLWGESNGHEEKIIDRDGQIYIDKVGVLSLGGKTIGGAEKYIKSKYSKIYSTLTNKTPKSFLDVTLGELKSVNVHFVGFVNIPGVHLIHPFSNVVTGLTQAGGVDINGSLRTIQVIRHGKIYSIHDLYDYMFSGQSIQSIRLLDQDIVFIPTRISTIGLTGRVRVPGYYEGKPNSLLMDIIKASGGRDSRASDQISLYRKETGESFIIDTTEKKDFVVMDGDSLHIPVKPEVIPQVTIGGHVRIPGDYPYQENMTFRDLLKVSESESDPNFYKMMDLGNIQIYRKNENGIDPIHLSINGLEDGGFLLQDGDHVNVPRIPVFEPIHSIVITGEVVVPGIYALERQSTLDLIIKSASGFTPQALKKGIEIYRDSLKIGWEHMDFFLQDGDSLHVRKETGLVRVDGEVNIPGYVSYKKGKSVKDYIKLAGGFNAFAEARDIVVIHPNGIAIPKSRWSSPKVLEGSTILVNTRMLSGSPQGPTGWQAFSIISNQAGNIATTLLTLTLLLNQSSSSSGN